MCGLSFGNLKSKYRSLFSEQGGFRPAGRDMFAQAPSLLGVEPEPHCQAVLDIMPGTSRSGSWWSQKRDLYALFCRFQASKATDERDKVYALLGLSSNPLDIKHRYRLQTADL